MSTTLLAGQRITYKWFKLCYEKLSYEHAIRQFCLQNTVQYCTLVKDKDKNISKDYNYENIASVHKDSRFQEGIIQQNKEQHDQLALHKINKESIIQKRVERLYPYPNSSVKNIYAAVSQELNDDTVLTLSCKQMKTKAALWEATFNMKWPDVMSFSAISKNKSVAIKNAALKCLVWLEMNDKLRNGKPIIYDTEEIKQKRLKPIELSVTPKIVDEMINVIKIYNTDIQDTAILEGKTSPISCNMLRPFTSAHPLLDKKKSKCDISTRNEILKERLLERRNPDITLPIHEFRNEILSKLQDNRVLLIEGDTGCGKTTQVPQFIMDSFARIGNASECNILISQPRRISAISLADRVAYERFEKVGDVVGFQVRLEQVLPAGFGGILFCTTGVLLKKLQANPGLLGCSHVILDEAHERHIDIDMLMILLKRALKLNLNLHVLIMSATINAHLFQKYFDCSRVKVPGRLHPVQMHFLEDIERLPNMRKCQVYEYNNVGTDNTEKITINFAKTAQVIKYICQHKPPGAILCFLPGWNEITKVQSVLENLLDVNQLILPIHSKMSHNDQRRIFERASPHTRKIILATDIAETGITVSDVVYVVDTAVRKEMRWNNEKDLSYVSNCWVSQANVQQRKGRAGRVKPGESYHLITKAQYEELESQPLPQILCNSLEKVVLDSKTYTDEKAEEFLSALIEPPSPFAIRKAVTYLMNLGIFDEHENLTALGKRMVLFPTHPKISKALVYSTIFNCMHPIITIAGIFSGEDNLFFGLLDNKPVIRENKRLFHPSSDHIALAWIFKQWAAYNLNEPNSILQFCKQMKLRSGRMEVLDLIRKTFIQQLIQSRMLFKNFTPDVYTEFDIALNKYEDDDELIGALLYSATQQLIELKDIGFKNGVARKMNQLQTQGRARAMISGESVNYKRKFWPSPFMTYLHSAHCETRRSTVIRESSMISPLSVLLFSQGETQCRELNNNDTEVIVKINQRQILRFSCKKETADVLLKFRDIMWSLVEFSLEKQGLVDYATDPTTVQVFEYKKKFLETLSKTLNEAAKPIEEADYKKKKSF